MIGSIAACWLPSCGSDASGSIDALLPGTPDAAMDAAPLARWMAAPPLPVPVSNNAVAALSTPSGCDVYSFGGIGAARTSAAITTAAFRLRAGQWNVLPALPGPARIAASAVAVAGKIYVVGGYTVASDSQETSSPQVDIWDPTTESWSSGPALAAGIDDAIVDVWRDRYVVVASGWSTTASVRTMSVLDTMTLQWSESTAFPGAPVFGGTGGIVGDDIFVIDGVATVNTRFVLTPQLWVGRLSQSDAAINIAWVQKANHSGGPRYRAAAGTVDGKLLVVGGTSEPYNYDGLRYDNNMPATPIADSLTIDASGVSAAATSPAATMDHRSLATCDGKAFLIGGMKTGPAVTDQVWLLP